MNDHSPELRNKIEQTTCVCTSSKGLFVPNRQISLLVALCIMIVTTTFLVGYFWGKRTAVYTLIEKVSHDSFADQIYTSVCSLYDQSPESSEQVTESQQTVASAEEVSAHVAQEQSTAVTEKHYYAQLVGFGDAKNAERFIARAKQKGFDLSIEKKISKTTKGKTIVWYQVVTAPVASYEDMKNIVDRISKEERLKGAQIVAC